VHVDHYIEGVICLRPLLIRQLSVKNLQAFRMIIQITLRLLHV